MADNVTSYSQGKPRLLLHICCVGCGVYASQLLMRDYEVMLYFYNPNIWPKEEHDKRLEEAKKFSKIFNLLLIVGEHNHEQWLNEIKGHERDPERGGRCLICYRLRLIQACEKAKQLNCKYITTTLTTSPHKDALAINKIGARLASDFGLNFLSRDFKKQDGFKKSSALSRELALYRQNYCGCEYSKRMKANY